VVIRNGELTATVSNTARSNMVMETHFMIFVILGKAIVLKPSTLFHLHHVLVKRKYRLLFSPKGRSKPGPKGPNKELI